MKELFVHELFSVLFYHSELVPGFSVESTQLIEHGVQLVHADNSGSLFGKTVILELPSPFSILIIHLLLGVELSGVSKATFTILNIPPWSDSVIL